MKIFGIGTDVINISRIDKLIKKNSSKFINRTFTKLEKNYCEKKKNSSSFYAKRFAAKEAFSKALGTGIKKDLSFKNIEIFNNKIYNNKTANTLFVEILMSEKNAETILRSMNETGVLGRFVPDFGQVVAQIYHDMYHVFTVDEHTLNAIGILRKIYSGEMNEKFSYVRNIADKIISRKVLIIALFFHDIAKGRGGDHSILGSEIAEKVCLRLGLRADEVETISWLVKYHLLMSNIAFKRDINDIETIRSFCDEVQSAERLRLLYVLTVVDIDAVGPNIWNEWKGIKDIVNSL